MNKMQIMPQIAWRGTKPPIGTTTSPALKRLTIETDILSCLSNFDYFGFVFDV